jgi:CRP-like cAMP-binding protein
MHNSAVELEGPSVPASTPPSRTLSGSSLELLALSSSPLLAGVDADGLRLLGGEENWLRLASGQLLFRQSDVPDYLYVVVRGRLEVSARRDGKDEVVAHVGRGGCVGETDSLTGEPR